RGGDIRIFPAFVYISTHFTFVYITTMGTLQSNVFEEEAPYYEPAPTGLRFANYIVDMILYYLVFFAVVLVFGILIAVAQAGSGDDASGFLDSGAGTLVMYLIAFSVLLLFFTLMEGATKGRSLGKLITGTVAIREDGTAITWKDALMRSLCRI